MAQYTIEDVEIIRQKSGLSYEEAVNLLEYHNGSLARALVDLEKNGRLRSEKAQSGSQGGLKGLFTLLYRLRLKVQKGDVSIVNLSALFILVVVLLAPHILIIGLVAAVVLGYRITVERNSREFSADSLDDMVKSARANVQHTVSGFAQQFTKDASATREDPKAEKPRAQSAPSGTQPVNVPFSADGGVNVHDEGDGYHEADIQ